MKLFKLCTLFVAGALIFLPGTVLAGETLDAVKARGGTETPGRMREGSKVLKPLFPPNIRIPSELLKRTPGLKAIPWMPS